MKKIISANLLPVLTWHPSWPRDGKKLEEDLWNETHGWNQGIILWLVSPDKKKREPVPYVDRETYRVTTAKQLEAKIREVFKKHKLKFVEPKPDPKPAPPPKD